MRPCVICARPAVEDLQCWRCDGSGTITRAMRKSSGWGQNDTDCTECGGSGKLPYCEKDAPKKRSELFKMGKLGILWEMDRATGKIHMGYVPPYSVVVSGNLPGKSLAGSLSGSASVHGAKQQAQANLAGKFADTTIKAQLGVNGFAPPGLNFGVAMTWLCAVHRPRMASRPRWSWASSGSRPITGVTWASFRCSMC